MSWLIRLFLMSGGIIAGWFVAKDAHNYEVVTFFATLLIFTFLVGIIAFKNEIIGFVRMVWENLTDKQPK